MFMNAESIHSLQASLRANRSLKILALCGLGLNNESIRLIADALDGNTTMETFDISSNRIATNGQDDITRLLESTEIKDINLGHNYGMFNERAATQRFAHALSQSQFVKTLNISFVDGSSAQAYAAAATTIFRALESNTVLEEMRIEQFDVGVGQQGMSQLIASVPRMKGLKRLHLNDRDLKLCLRQLDSFLPALHQNTSLQVLSPLDSATFQPGIKYVVAVAVAKNVLARNCVLKKANALLALQPRTGMPIAP
jgi:Ran GTPase-activating protein (RanGAP) involved in mRNA processing and transport